LPISIGMHPIVQLAAANDSLIVGEWADRTITLDEVNCRRVAVYSWSGGTANWYISSTRQLTTCLSQSRWNVMTMKCLSVPNLSWTRGLPLRVY